AQPDNSSGNFDYTLVARRDFHQRLWIEHSTDVPSTKIAVTQTPASIDREFREKRLPWDTRNFPLASERLS
ncbi:MAG TPA: hypothetical protein VJW55_01315, partial [Candidatus Angelobacter sp.]|nr:hypothetical protein [Candidatus Angelobacter sp.]